MILVGVNSIVRDKLTYQILASYWDWRLWKVNKIFISPFLLNRVNSRFCRGEGGGTGDQWSGIASGGELQAILTNFQWTSGLVAKWECSRRKSNHGLKKICHTRFDLKPFFIQICLGGTPHILSWWREQLGWGDIGQNVPNFPGLVWKADLGHIFGNIGIYFSKPIFTLKPWVRAGRFEYHEPHNRNIFFSFIKGS